MLVKITYSASSLRLQEVGLKVHLLILFSHFHENALFPSYSAGRMLCTICRVPGYLYSGSLLFRNMNKLLATTVYLVTINSFSPNH